jgi:hypothetical protein
MSNPKDKWFYDACEIVRAGIIMCNGVPTFVGDPDYLPFPHGKGLGHPEKKIREIDAEGPSFEEIFNPPA